MKRLLLSTCWIGVIVIAVVLRFEQLGDRPVHADEATGARITSMRLESESYRFDPLHFHGPTLSSIGAHSARLVGQTQWSEMEITPFRAIPATAGCLLALVPWLGRKRFGNGAMLLASLALASSPLLVYYSRMFIHETLLALFGALALFQFTSTRRWWPAGLWIGLMFATKESFAISMIAWLSAAGILWLAFRHHHDQPDFRELFHRHGRQTAAALVSALVVSMAFYTQGFTQWQGAVDSVRTFFVYKTGEGHDKAFGYYGELLLWPRQLGGLWWFETPVFLAAALALLASFRSRNLPQVTRVAIWFLSLSAGIHFLIYSLISYKTPWLMVLPMAHVCILAGFSLCLVSGRGRHVGALAGVFLFAAFASQFIQARHATGRFASGARNPYAYVPTSTDLDKLEPWLQSLDSALPELPLKPIAVVGDEYWPLPWYLRHRDQIGYWPEPFENINRLPLVFATIDLSDELAVSHIPIPRGLRDEVPMIAWVRQDVWDAATRTVE